MRKEQARKNPRETSLTPKQDDNTSKSLELSEGQLEAHFRLGPRRKVGPIGNSWLCCWPKKWREENRRDCNVVRGAHTSRSSRPSTSSTSRCSQRSGSP